MTKTLIKCDQANKLFAEGPKAVEHIVRTLSVAACLCAVLVACGLPPQPRNYISRVAGSACGTANTSERDQRR